MSDVIGALQAELVRAKELQVGAERQAGHFLAQREEALRGLPYLRRAVLEALSKERARQEAKFPGQTCPDGTGHRDEREAGGIISAKSARSLCDQAFSDGGGSWAHILIEEVAEALEETAPGPLRKELVEVAAVCLRWIDSIDGRSVSPSEKEDR